MRRWYDGITATIALTVIVSMIVGFTLQQLGEAGRNYLGLGPERVVGRQGGRPAVWLPGRIANLIEVIDSVPNSDRPAAIAAATQNQLQIEIADTPLLNPAKRKGGGTGLLHRRIENELKTPRTVIVSTTFAGSKPGVSAGSESLENGIIVETPLTDGHWLQFHVNLNLEPKENAAATKIVRITFVIWATIFALLAVFLSIVAGRRLVRPLAELAAAVEQLGGSGEALQLVPRGPYEVQTTIRAFNRMQERLRRFNDDRTRMLAAMSHDLQTPITRLQLRLEFVEDVEQRKKMLSDLALMSEMIESTLSFARDDTQHEPRSLVDLTSLVEGICEDAADAGEQVTSSGPRNVTVFCRPTMIRRAISNLIDNAIKYGDRAEVSLTSEKERAVLIIEDDGPGIPRTERERVFEPFYRMERSRNPETGGVGLGLAVTRSIVWEHGGDIILSNRKGGGLKVKLELPLDISHTAAAPTLGMRDVGEIAAGTQDTGSASMAQKA